MKCVYILANPAMPAYLKIGQTDNLDERLHSLNASAAVPFSFRVVAAYEVDNPLHIEQQIHKIFETIDPSIRAREQRSNGPDRVREFFKVDEDSAKAVFQSIAAIAGNSDKLHIPEMTAEQIEEEEIADSSNNFRGYYFRFSDVGIEPGAALEFKLDPNCLAYVIDDKRVSYNGQEYSSISRLASELLEERGKFSRVTGSRWFYYQGELLADIIREHLKQSAAEA